MNTPQMFDAVSVAPQTSVLPAYMPLPGLGVLPVNTFLIHGSEPILIDTGLAALRDEFLAALARSIDPEDLRWIYITHTDADHIGNLGRVLDLAPKARVVTTYLGMGKLSMLQPVPPDRVYLLNPGQSLVTGDRSLRAFKPASFDAPETTGFVDSRTGVMFSSDSFGAVLTAPQQAALDIASDELRQGMATWASVDAPWLHRYSEGALEQALEPVTAHNPELVLSSHLPPAARMTEVLLGNLRAARVAPAFVGPDQQALLGMMSAA